jgi:hypothetical protein
LLDGEGIAIVEGVEERPLAPAKKNVRAEFDEAEVEEDVAVPLGFVLHQNYPNPFSANRAFGNPSTVISFTLPETGKVTVNIYNETGQLVRSLVDREMPAGRQSLNWNGRDQSGKTVAAGVYLYRLVVTSRAGEPMFIATKRMTFLK